MLYQSTGLNLWLDSVKIVC